MLPPVLDLGLKTVVLACLVFTIFILVSLMLVVIDGELRDRRRRKGGVA